MTEPTSPSNAARPVAEATRVLFEEIGTYSVQCAKTGELAPSKSLLDAVDALAALAQPSVEAPARRVYGSQYTPEQRAWCEKYEHETTFEPLMCDFEVGNETFLEAAKNSRAWFESWSSDAYLRGCDHIPGEMEALYEEVTGEKHEDA